MGWIWTPLKLTLVTVLIAAPNCIADAQSLTTPTAEQQGVRHLLYATIKSNDPNVRVPQDGSSKAHTASITVKIHIFDNAPKTRFFGDVHVVVSEFDLRKGSKEQKVWEDARCHERRGVPKMTIISIGGSMLNGQERIAIDARIRRIGLPLPRDEVMAASRLALGSDAGGSFIETHTETKQSRILVDLKMYTVPCNIRFTATP